MGEGRLSVCNRTAWFEEYDVKEDFCRKHYKSAPCGHCVNELVAKTSDKANSHGYTQHRVVETERFVAPFYPVDFTRERAPYAPGKSAFSEVERRFLTGDIYERAKLLAEEYDLVHSVTPVKPVSKKLPVPRFYTEIAVPTLQKFEGAHEIILTDKE